MIEVSFKIILCLIILFLLNCLLIKIDYEKTFKVSSKVNSRIIFTLFSVMWIYALLVVYILCGCIVVKPSIVYTSETQLVSLDGIKISENKAISERGNELKLYSVTENKNSTMYDMLYANVRLESDFWPFVYKRESSILELTPMNYKEYERENYDSIYLVEDPNARLNITEDIRKNNDSKTKKNRHPKVEGF